MADENVALKKLKDIEDGIDYIINLSQMFVDGPSNAARVHLFNARQCIVEMQSMVVPAGSREPIENSPAQGTINGGNIGGTGSPGFTQPAAPDEAPAEAPAVVADQAPVIDGAPVVSQKEWEGLSPAVRAALTAAGQAPAQASAQDAPPAAQEPPAVAPAADAPEDQASAQRPPWAPQDGAPTA